MAIQLLDYRLKIDEKNLKVDCYFPGISYADFDRVGNVCPWKICRMFEAGRAIPLRHGNFLDYKELSSNGKFSYFVLGGDYFFDPSLWEGTLRHQYFPYKITTELISIGQTSITLKEVLINLVDHKVLATYIGKLVYVDRKTNRPQVLPSWHHTKYQRMYNKDGVRINTAVSSIPENAYSTTLVVAASDTDHNGHTNQGSYIRFCLDAAESARQSNLLHQFTSDVCMYPIAKMSVAYPGETLTGNKLTVTVWEADLNSRTLLFAISRETTVVFVATINFKDKPSSKL